MLKKLTHSIIVLAIVVNVSFAGGFQINEHGARAMAMAGAFTGLADDPSALFYNGAGLTQLSGTHIVAGVTLIAPSASFRGPSPAITEYSLQDQLFHPINFYITHQFDEKERRVASLSCPNRFNSSFIGKSNSIYMTPTIPFTR